MHRIIFLNGPPRSGKDEGASIIVRNFPARRYKMSRPLKDGLAAFFGFNHAMMRDIEANKDEEGIVALFNGLSWRQAQISLSETWAKRVFGDDIFGKLAVMYLREATSTDITVISDSGFLHECLPIVRHFRPSQCLLIQLMRDGCTFEGDSRSYIELDEFGVTTVQLHNRFPLVATDKEPITYEMQLCQVVRQWMGQEQTE